MLNVLVTLNSKKQGGLDMILSEKLIGKMSGRDRKFWHKTIDILAAYVNFVLTIKNENFDICCHDICRALAKHIPGLRVVDGNFVGMRQVMKSGELHMKLTYCSHSWLITPSGAIIDPYPVGLIACNPIILPKRGIGKHFGYSSYLKESSVKKAINTKKTRDTSNRLARLMKKALIWAEEKEKAAK